MAKVLEVADEGVLVIGVHVSDDTLLGSGIFGCLVSHFEFKAALQKRLVTNFFLVLGLLFDAHD